MPPGDRGRIAQIRRVHGDLSAGFLPDPFAGRRDGVAAARRDGDAGALERQRARDGKAEALARAADHRDFAGEVKIHLS